MSVSSRYSGVIEFNVKTPIRLHSAGTNPPRESPFPNVRNLTDTTFNGKLRDECLNLEVFTSLAEAKVVIEDFRLEYNHRRPHSSLGYLPPAVYAATLRAGTPLRSPPLRPGPKRKPPTYTQSKPRRLSLTLVHRSWAGQPYARKIASTIPAIKRT